MTLVFIRSFIRLFCGFCTHFCTLVYVHIACHRRRHRQHYQIAPIFGCVRVRTCFISICTFVYGVLHLNKCFFHLRLVFGYANWTKFDCKSIVMLFGFTLYKNAQKLSFWKCSCGYEICIRVDLSQFLASLQIFMPQISRFFLVFGFVSGI